MVSARPPLLLVRSLHQDTLLAAPIIARLGELKLEPITVTYGATIMSDTFAVRFCHLRFDLSARVFDLQPRCSTEIAIFIPLILFGLSRLGAYCLKKERHARTADNMLSLALVFRSPARSITSSKRTGARVQRCSTGAPCSKEC